MKAKIYTQAWRLKPLFYSNGNSGYGSTYEFASIFSKNIYHIEKKFLIPSLR